MIPGETLSLLKVRVKCNEDDTVGDLKKLIAAQTGTKWDKIVLKKWYTIYKVLQWRKTDTVQTAYKMGICPIENLSYARQTAYKAGFIQTYTVQNAYKSGFCPR